MRTVVFRWTALVVVAVAAIAAMQMSGCGKSEDQGTRTESDTVAVIEGKQYSLSELCSAFTAERLKAKAVPGDSVIWKKRSVTTTKQYRIADAKDDLGDEWVKCAVFYSSIMAKDYVAWMNTPDLFDDEPPKPGEAEVLEQHSHAPPNVPPVRMFKKPVLVETDTPPDVPTAWGTIEAVSAEGWYGVEIASKMCIAPVLDSPNATRVVAQGPKDMPPLKVGVGVFVRHDHKTGRWHVLYPASESMLRAMFGPRILAPVQPPATEDLPAPPPIEDGELHNSAEKKTSAIRLVAAQQPNQSMRGGFKRSISTTKSPSEIEELKSRVTVIERRLGGDDKQPAFRFILATGLEDWGHSYGDESTLIGAEFNKLPFGYYWMRTYRQRYEWEDKKIVPAAGEWFWHDWQIVTVEHNFPSRKPGEKIEDVNQQQQQEDLRKNPNKRKIVGFYKLDCPDVASPKVKYELIPISPPPGDE